MADGVSYEGIFGKGADRMRASSQAGATMSLGGARGGGGGFAGGTGGAAAKSTNAQYDRRQEFEQIMAANPEIKIEKTLRDKKTGTFEIEVLVKDWPEGWKKLLEDAGLKVEDSISDLKVVYGTADAKVLVAIAKLGFVTEIRPVED